MTSRDLGLPLVRRLSTYPVEKELQAELDGMRYWVGLRDLGSNLKDFERQNYSGHTSHPTQTRLKHALRACRWQTELSVQP